MRSTVWLAVVLFFCVGAVVLAAREAMASTESITQLTSLDPEFKPIKFLLPKGVRLTSITSDGSAIAFSWWEYLPVTNPDCSGEIFVVNSDGTGLLQLTTDDSIDGPYHSLFPSISADGAVVAFASEANLTGANPDNWYQIFAVDPDGNGLCQLTDGAEPFDSLFPSISGDGSLVVFQSKADFTEENPNHTSQVFLALLSPSPPEEI
jgi:Tol biopolymer transport system component